MVTMRRQLSILVRSMWLPLTLATDHCRGGARIALIKHAPLSTNNLFMKTSPPCASLQLRQMFRLDGGGESVLARS